MASQDIQASHLVEEYFNSPTEDNLIAVSEHIINHMSGAYIELTTRRFCYLIKRMSDSEDRLTDPNVMETIFKAIQYRTTGIEKWLKAGGGQTATK